MFYPFDFLSIFGGVNFFHPRLKISPKNFATLKKVTIFVIEIKTKHSHIKIITTMTPKRNRYYKVCERGFCNEYYILTATKDDEKYISALEDWSLVTPNGYFKRKKRSELSSADLQEAIRITKFRFSYRGNDSEEDGEKDYFNRMVDELPENKY